MKSFRCTHFLKQLLLRETNNSLTDFQGLAPKMCTSFYYEKQHFQSSLYLSLIILYRLTCILVPRCWKEVANFNNSTKILLLAFHKICFVTDNCLFALCFQWKISGFTTLDKLHDVGSVLHWHLHHRTSCSSCQRTPRGDGNTGLCV